MPLLVHSPGTSSLGRLYAATVAFALTPTTVVAALGQASFSAWSIAATFILSAAWPIAQRLHAMSEEEREQNKRLRNHLASAADAALRAETLLIANGQRLQEMAEQIRIAALNVRLQSRGQVGDDDSLAAAAEGLETLAHQAENMGRAAVRSRELSEHAASLSDEATQNLARLTEELHNIATAVDRDIKRAPTTFESSAS